MVLRTRCFAPLTAVFNCSEPRPALHRERGGGRRVHAARSYADLQSYRSSPLTIDEQTFFSLSMQIEPRRGLGKHLQIISSWTPKRKRFNWWKNSKWFLKRVESNHDKLGLCHTSYGYGVQIHSSRTNQKGNPDRERRRDTVPPCRAGHEPAGQRASGMHAAGPPGQQREKGAALRACAHGPCHAPWSLSLCSLNPSQKAGGRADSTRRPPQL